jgi:hypothetical protein
MSLPCRHFSHTQILALFQVYSTIQLCDKCDRAAFVIRLQELSQHWRITGPFQPKSVTTTKKIFHQYYELLIYSDSAFHALPCVNWKTPHTGHGVLTKFKWLYTKQAAFGGICCMKDQGLVSCYILVPKKTFWNLHFRERINGYI